MKRLALILALLAPISAFAFIHGGGRNAVVASCPQTGWTSLDGCSGAPAYDSNAPALSFKNPTLDTDGTIFQTPGFSGSFSNVNWNVPLKDFAVGVDTSGGAFCNGAYVSAGNPSKPCSTTAGTNGLLINANDYNWAGDPAGFCPGGVSANVTYSDGSKRITCNLTGDTTFQGLDLTPTSCSAGPSCCVSITFGDTGTTGGKLTIRNVRYKTPLTGAACHYYQQWGTINGAFLYGINFTNATHVWDVDFFNNAVDQDIATNWIANDSTTLGGYVGTGFLNLSVLGHARVRYNYFGASNGRFFNINFCTGADFSYNAVPIAMYASNAAHSEAPFFNLLSTCGTTVAVDYFTENNNLVVSPYNIPGATWTALIWMNLGNSGQTMNVAVGGASLNILAANYVRPSQHFYTLVNAPTPNWTICFNTTAGCSGSGASATGTYANGDILTVTIPGSLSNASVRLWGPVSGTGTSTTANALAWNAGEATSDLGNTTWYTTSCLSCTGTGSGAMVQLLNGGLNSWQNVTLSTNGMMGFNSNSGTLVHYAQLNIQNNGFYGPGAYPAGTPAAYLANPNALGATRICAVAQTVTGNFNLHDNSAISWYGGNGIQPC
jgi:hypothetical protein